VIVEYTAPQGAWSSHFDEDDTITFLFEEPTAAINFLRAAGLSEASSVILSRSSDRRKSQQQQRGQFCGRQF